MVMNPQALEKQFLAVYEANQDAIFRHCYFRVFNRERAKELSQEAFMKTWVVLAEGKDVKNVKAFVYKVANNLIIDESRKKHEESLESLQAIGFDPAVSGEQHIIEKIDAETVLQIAKQLEPEYREVVLLRYIDEFTPKEIADILGTNANVVSVRINRAVKALKKLMNI